MGTAEAAALHILHGNRILDILTFLYIGPECEDVVVWDCCRLDAEGASEGSKILLAGIEGIVGIKNWSRGKACRWGSGGFFIE